MMIGISFTAVLPLSKEAKEKLELMEIKRKKRLNKMKEDYHNGVFDEFIDPLKKIE